MAETSLAAFQYQALPSTPHIRLVALAGHRDEPTSCEILSFHLDEAPSYFGLSYCWGTATESVALKVFSLTSGDAYISISSSLYAALVRLKASIGGTAEGLEARHQSAMYIWIDQICINQRDNEEKGAQVKLTRDIYHRGEQTVIWLGDADDATDKPAFKILTKIREIRQTQLQSVSDERGLLGAENLEQPMDMIEEEENQRLGLPPFWSDDWAALAKLLQRPWFNRVWIIQEAAMPRRHPLLLCGDRMLDWDSFADAIDWLDRRSYDSVTAFHFYPFAPFFIHKVRRTFSVEKQAPHLWSLDAVLAMVRKVGATDARDHIYALLGLASDVSEAEWPKVLEPNYNRDQDTLLCEVARYCIQKSRNLDILRAGGCPESVSKNSSEVPSWMPRWDLEYDPSISKTLPYNNKPRFDTVLNRVVVSTDIVYDASLEQSHPSCLACPEHWASSS